MSRTLKPLDRCLKLSMSPAMARPVEVPVKLASFIAIRAC